MPIAIRLSRPATSQEANLTAARLPHVPRRDAAGLARQAQAAGMRSVGPNQWQASDGSWVMLSSTGTIERGYGSVAFQGKPGAAQVVAPVQRPAAPVRPAAPPRSAPATGSITAAHMKTTALGRSPMMMTGNAATWGPRLRALGFIQSGNRFAHGDGSLVDFSGGRAALSYNGTPLGRLPRWW